MEIKSEACWLTEKSAWVKTVGQLELQNETLSIRRREKEGRRRMRRGRRRGRRRTLLGCNFMKRHKLHMNCN